MDKKKLLFTLPLAVVLGGYQFVGFSFQAGRKTGAREEAKRHNRIVGQDSKKYQW